MYEHAAGRDLKRSFDWLEFAAGLPAHHVPYKAASASFQGFKGSCILQAVWVNNGNAAGQTFILTDGEDATGPIIHQAFIGNGQNQNQPFSPRGILCETGVFVQLFGGPWNMTLFVVPLWHYTSTPPGE